MKQPVEIKISQLVDSRNQIKKTNTIKAENNHTPLLLSDFTR
jgi:hypothetical protein